MSCSPSSGLPMLGCCGPNACRFAIATGQILAAPGFLVSDFARMFRSVSVRYTPQGGPDFFGATYRSDGLAVPPSFTTTPHLGSVGTNPFDTPFPIPTTFTVATLTNETQTGTVRFDDPGADRVYDYEFILSEPFSLFDVATSARDALLAFPVPLSPQANSWKFNYNFRPDFSFDLISSARMFDFLVPTRFNAVLGSSPITRFTISQLQFASLAFEALGAFVVEGFLVSPSQNYCLDDFHVGQKQYVFPLVVAGAFRQGDWNIHDSRSIITRDQFGRINGLSSLCSDIGTRQISGGRIACWPR